MTEIKKLKFVKALSQHNIMSKFTFYGHSCFSLEYNGKKLLFDPFLGGHPDPDRARKEIQADYILVSHGHVDHTADLIALATSTGAQILSSYEICEWCKSQGIQNVLPFNIGGERQLEFGRVKYTYAQHSSVLPDGTYGANPGGFLLMSENQNIYYSGDTSLCMDMQLVPTRAIPHAVILPIGDVFTMGLDDALTASEFLKSDTIIGVHFDTFEDIKIDHLQAQEKAQLRSKKLILPEIDATIDI